MSEARLTAIMLVQQLEDEYWRMLDDKTTLQRAREGNCQPLLKEIVKRLNTGNIKVEEAYGIVHDKDTIRVWNSVEMKQIDELKTKHIHFLFKFTKGATLINLARVIGVEPQYLEKLKSGRYGYDNCLSYLVHAKDETKYQYSPVEVVTFKGEDYLSIYNRQMPNWVKGRATKKARETNLSVDWLTEQVLAGKITKSNILLTDEYYTIYGQHKRKINEALETAGERKSHRTVAELEKGLFKKSVIFIQASSGMGKTRYSKKLIQILQNVANKYNQSWDFCVTASTNAFDEYLGQDILFLDDIRGDSLSVSDWLKLLDPHMVSPISARYHNKMGSARVIIITSTKDPIGFFQNAKGNIGEDLGQFVRRIDLLLYIDKSFLLSTPEKLKIPFDIPRNPLLDSLIQSFRFSKPTAYSKNEALDFIVKTIIRNNQWNKKEVISDTDQSNKDTPNAQQK